MQHLKHCSKTVSKNVHCLTMLWENNLKHFYCSVITEGLKFSPNVSTSWHYHQLSEVPPFDKEYLSNRVSFFLGASLLLIYFTKIEIKVEHQICIIFKVLVLVMSCHRYPLKSHYDLIPAVSEKPKRAV